MAWFYYLLEANVYCCVLYAFYHWVLKRETLYILNRWYLIFSCIIAFTLPFFQITYSTAITLSNKSLFQPEVAVIYDPSLGIVKAEREPLNVVPNNRKLDVRQIFTFVYFLVVMISLSRLGSRIFYIVKLYRISKKKIENEITYVFIDGYGEVFSFFKWLFIDHQLLVNQAILQHEKVHIRQGHSYDVIFFELLQRINWFNPLFRKILSDVKLNHEYISDQHTVESTINRHDYANLLIEYAYQPKSQLTHSAFRQSQLEARIERLTLRKSSRQILVKYTLSIPLILCLFYISAFKVNKSYAKFQLTFHENKPPLKIDIHRYSNADLRQQSIGSFSSSPSESKLKHSVRKGFQLSKKKAEQPCSELIGGSRMLDKLASELALKGQKLYARDYLFYWTVNHERTKIRKVTHGVLSGTEAQLFRGDTADTLYVDRQFYVVKDQTVKVLTDNLLINHIDMNQHSDKKLVLVDPYLRKIMYVLDEVDIRTNGAVYQVVINPDYGYERKMNDSVPSKYVDTKLANTKSNYLLTAFNSRVREAKITATELITNETNLPKEDPWQPGILW